MVQWALRAELLHGGPRTIATFVEVLAPWETPRALPTAPKRRRKRSKKYAKMEAKNLPKRRSGVLSEQSRNIHPLLVPQLGSFFALVGSWVPFLGAIWQPSGPRGGAIILYFGNRVDINGSNWRFWIATDTESKKEPKVEPNMYGF